MDRGRTRSFGLTVSIVLMIVGALLVMLALALLVANRPVQVQTGASGVSSARSGAPW